MENLNVILHSSSLKVFVAAVHALSKADEHISIRATSESLILTSLSASSDVYFHAEFKKTFFYIYEFSGIGDDSQAIENIDKSGDCIVVEAKYLLMSLSSLKGVKSLQIYFSVDGPVHTMVMLFDLGDGLSRSNCLNYFIGEYRTVYFNKDTAPNGFVASPDYLSTILDTLTDSDSITFLFTSKIFQLQEFMEPNFMTSDNKKQSPKTLTATAGQMDKLLKYNYLQPSQTPANSQLSTSSSVLSSGSLVNVTFKKLILQTMLTFCNMVKGVHLQELLFHFSNPGSPVMFSTQGTVSLSYELKVIATSIDSHVLPLPNSPATS